MTAPPVPPRPFDDYDDYMRSDRGPSLPPAIPPLPPDFRPDLDDGDEVVIAPHLTEPLAAPRPTKMQPDLPANMARSLDAQVHDPSRGRSPRPLPNAGPVPGGFVSPAPGARGVSPYPPPQGTEWSPWAGAMPEPSIALTSPPLSAPATQPSYTPRTSSHHHSASLSAAPALPRTASPAPAALTAPLPTVQALQAAQAGIQQTQDPARRLAWARDVLTLVDRALDTAQAEHVDTPAAAPAPPAPGVEIPPDLARLAAAALPMLLQLTSAPSPPPEGLFLLACAEASGYHPAYVQHSPRNAFRHFEQAAKAGWSPAWFRLGRDYETFGDVPHARQCFERGIKANDTSCIYRMGMANLLGQLGLPANAATAIPLLHRAATAADVTTPQPAYVFALLLLGEFAPAAPPPSLFTPYVPPNSSVPQEGRRHLERAAYLGYAPAQYKLGHAYEFAAAPFSFDALLSVQYYSLASQQGVPDADMALSKWFLCGSEGAFEKDEGLAVVFARKAASKGLSSAEFAMGYYCEVGVGGEKDIDAAVEWYSKAEQHGNPDAADRLAVLSGPSAQSLSRAEHETLTDTTLVRKRTQAKQRSDARAPPPGSYAPPAPGGTQALNVARKNSLMSARVAAGAGAGRMPPGEERGRPVQQVQAQHAHVASLSPHGSRQPYQPQQGYAPYPNVPPAANGATPRPGGPGAQAQWAAAQRYSLADPGSSPAPSAATSPRPMAGPGGVPGGRPPRQGTPTMAGVGAGQPQPPRPPPPGEQEVEDDAPRRVTGTGPKTFEEMGFQSAKLEEKECVVM